MTALKDYDPIVYESTVQLYRKAGKFELRLSPDKGWSTLRLTFYPNGNLKNAEVL